MGGLLGGIKRFLSNKNTVTILAAIAGVIVLWFFYNWRVNQAVTLVAVPVAKEPIGATNEIILENLETVHIPQEIATDQGIITTTAQLQNMYITTGTSIPKGGFFYTDQVVPKTEIPNTILENLPDGHTLFYLPVDVNSTYGNSIYPGDKIDLYIRYRDEDGIINFGMLISKLEVLTVRDAAQNDIFEDMETGNSALLIFSVDNEYFHLLEGAREISGLEMLAVPRNKNYTEEEGSSEIESTHIRLYIESKTLNVTDK